jgi:hypothetical protein
MKKVFSFILVSALAITAASAQSQSDTRKKQFNLDKSGLPLRVKRRSPLLTKV